MSLLQYIDVEIHQAEHIVLKDVNLEVGDGELIYLLGKVGSGKSSLLKTIYGALPIASGTAMVLGQDMAKIRRRKLPYLRRRLGIVFQDYKLLTDRSVEDNLLFVLKATGWKDKKLMKTQVHEVLQQVGMESKAYKRPYQLSGGEQQRVVIARALLNSPEMILADEPTGNLDPETGNEIMELLSAISKAGITVLVSTHNQLWPQRYPGKQWHFEEGKVNINNAFTGDAGVSPAVNTGYTGVSPAVNTGDAGVSPAGSSARTGFVCNVVSSNASASSTGETQEPIVAPVILDHCRKYLPHIENKHLQAITFRLYDSLPQEVLQEYKNRLINADENTQAQQIRQLVEQYEDTGYGQCFLKDTRIAQIVQDALKFNHGKQYQLISWSIMPNHVHVLIEVLSGYSLSTILHTWRSYTAHEANKVLQRTGDFWMEEYYDRYIRDINHFNNAVRYIDNNAVNAGLVRSAKDYAYCSVGDGWYTATGDALTGCAGVSPAVNTGDAGVSPAVNTGDATVSPADKAQALPVNAMQTEPADEELPSSVENE